MTALVREKHKRLYMCRPIEVAFIVVGILHKLGNMLTEYRKVII
jgi:hypothetical protein